MNYHTFTVVCLLLFAVAFDMAMAQGVVVESVDEDVVEDDAPPPAAVDKSVVKDSVVDKKAAVGKSTAKDTVTDKKAVAGKKSAADSSAARKKTPVKKELDLDALLGSDDEGDLLVEEEKPAAPVAVDSAAADTSAKSSELAGDEKTPVSADSAAPAVQGRRGRPAAPKAAAKTDPASLGPLVIEDGRSINFAHNLTEYRSPRIAMLLSLLVPGLGQAYARSYVKAGAFGAAELATIGAAVYFNLKGKSTYEDAKKFAGEHYDAVKMEKYADDLLEEFERRVEEGQPDSIINKYPHDYYDTSFFNIANAKDKEPYFYESIRDVYYTPGWDDSYPLLDEVLTLSGTGKESDTLFGADGSKYVLSYDVSKEAWMGYFYSLTRIAGNGAREEKILGYSDNQVKYSSIISKSNSYYNAVNYTFYVLLLNHIASAIDAGFTARAYNARLLGQESAWNRLSVEQTYVYTGSEMSPGLALRVRF